jgi:hypothetical protein
MPRPAKSDSYAVDRSNPLLVLCDAHQSAREVQAAVMKRREIRATARVGDYRCLFRGECPSGTGLNFLRPDYSSMPGIADRVTPVTLTRRATSRGRQAAWRNRNRGIQLVPGDLDARIVVAGAVAQVGFMRGSQCRHRLSVRARPKPRAFLRADHPGAHVSRDVQR